MQRPGALNTAAEGTTYRRSRIHLARPLHLAQTLGMLWRGRGDLTMRVTADEVCRATRTPHGAASQRLRITGETLEVEAWGEGAEWCVERAAVLVGEQDRAAGFEPRHPLLVELHRQMPGLRIPRTEAVFETALPLILEQKVVGVEARRAYVRLIGQLGEPAPGPLGLQLQPSPARLARTPYWHHHRNGVERRRAETIRIVAGLAGKLEEAVEMPPSQARARLEAIPGIGPWTAAEVALVALGDADAVSVGDYHLPHVVSWALAREPRGSDQRMLDLLEPYRGHRGRVLRLLTEAGIGAPRFGPRLPLRNIAAH